MSLVERSVPAADAGLPLDVTNTRLLDKSDLAFTSPIFDKFCNVESQDTMAPNPKFVHPNAKAPDLPPKSALRASRMLENLGLKQLGGAVEAAGLVQATTPHDVYLSSEEDASSDADDFSDYDYDSSVEDPTSPTRRSSHEDTARVVSVVFAGKPLIVDLPTSRKRPVSTSSMGTRRTRSSTDSAASAGPPTRTSSAATEDRPVTPASTVSSRSQSRPNIDTSPNNRNSTLLSGILVKKKPPFLSIDPYANSSTYFLHVPKALDSLEGENPAKTPRTPTALLKGVTRSFSLARKRSKPALKGPSPQPPVPRLDTPVAALAQPKPNRTSVVHVEKQEQAQQQPHESDQQQQQPPPPNTPQTPVTYNDILRAVKKNATVMGVPLPRSDIPSPASPGAGTARRGILSGFAARRRSIKLTGRY